MANHILLYGRPIIAPSTPLPPLRIEGTLPGYRKGQAYSGSLDIVDSVGKCKVELVSGGLPNGHRLYVDNVLKKVMLKWDAFLDTEGQFEIPNWSFENDDEGWLLGEGWSVSTASHHHGAKSLAFNNFQGTSEVLGTRVPLKNPAAQVALSCQVQQGASSKKNVGARVFLRWYNGSTVLGTSYGNLVDSASNGAWNISSVSGTGPAGSTHVAPGAEGQRKRENKPLFLDEFTWDLKWVPGSDIEPTYSIVLKVTDGLNRVAYWIGTLGIRTFVRTTVPFPLLVAESLTSGAELLRASTREQPDLLEEPVRVGGEVLDVVVRLMTQDGYSTETLRVGGTVLSVVVATPLKTYTNAPEILRVGGEVLTSAIKVHPQGFGGPEILRVGGEVIGVTIT